MARSTTGLNTSRRRRLASPSPSPSPTPSSTPSSAPTSTSQSGGILTPRGPSRSHVSTRKRDTDRAPTESLPAPARGQSIRVRPRPCSPVAGVRERFIKKLAKAEAAFVAIQVPRFQKGSRNTCFSAKRSPSPRSSNPVRSSDVLLSRWSASASSSACCSNRSWRSAVASGRRPARRTAVVARGNRSAAAARTKSPRPTTRAVASRTKAPAARPSRPRNAAAATAAS